MGCYLKINHHPMFEIPPAVNRGFLAALDRESISSNRKPYFIKWLRYFLDFCDRHNQLPGQKDSLEAFLIKLTEKGQDSFRQRQAAHAVAIYWRITNECITNDSSSDKATRDGASNEDKWDSVVLSLKRRIETLQYSKKSCLVIAISKRR